MEFIIYVVTLNSPSCSEFLMAHLANTPFFDVTTQEEEFVKTEFGDTSDPRVMKQLVHLLSGHQVQVKFKTTFSEPYAMKQLIDLLSGFEVQVMRVAKCVSTQRLAEINRALSSK